MFTTRKRHLRKKRFFLLKQETFALFNASNLKTQEVTEIRISLRNAKLYAVPLYLKPPKLGLGYPLIMIIYDKAEDLQINLPQVTKRMDCLGISLNKKWYSTQIFEKDNLINLDKKILALLLTKTKK